MDKDRELASKVDALLGKHGRAPTRAAADAGDDRNIPVLTEIVDAPDWSPGKSGAVPAATSSLQAMGSAEIDALSHAIFTRVMTHIDERLADQLEDRLSALFSTQLNAAVTGVMGDMRQDIANEIGDAVNAALADQLRKK